MENKDLTLVDRFNLESHNAEKVYENAFNDLKDRRAKDLKNLDKKGENIRDCASIEQLLVLANLENINALLIESGISKEERLLKLNAIAINQMTALSENKSVTRLSDLHNQPQALLENHNKNE